MLRTAAIAVGLSAAFAIGHPYLGIIGDSTLYLGRALADLDPGGVGRDIAFALDGQSRFSIFSWIADPLVAAVGAQRAGMIIAAAASACFLAAAAALAWALSGERRVIVAAVLAAALMPAAYGAGIFRIAETAAVPRPFAEAAVLAAIVAMLARRRTLAAVFLLLALAVHPIMAMAGVGTLLVLAAWRRTLRASLLVILAFSAAFGLALALGAAGVPLLSRLVARIDADWLGMLTTRSPYLFPSRWSAAAFAAPAVQVMTIALALRYVEPLARRLLIAATVSSFAQLAAAAVLGDVLHLLLAIQVQGWRALWLLDIVAVVCLPLVLSRLWREGTEARVILALLGLAWLCPLGLPATLGICSLALALRVTPGLVPIGEKQANWALATAALVAMAVAGADAFEWGGLVARGPREAAPAFVLALRSDFLFVPVWLSIAVWLIAKPRPTRLPVLCGLSVLLTVVAAKTWDERRSFPIWGDQDAFEATRNVPGTSSSEVFVVGGLASGWFALGRPQFFSPEQAAGIVFSRPLAMEWRRRAEVLRALGLVPRNTLRPWDALAADDKVHVTADNLAALCARSDAPAAVVVPDRDDVPAPMIAGAATWKATAPHSIVEKYQPPQWHAIDAWTVIACAALRQRAPLAKSTAR